MAQDSLVTYTCHLSQSTRGHTGAPQKYLVFNASASGAKVRDRGSFLPKQHPAHIAIPILFADN